MSAVFLELFNRAVSAGWLLLALLLKKLPAWARCLLWGLAAVRLVLPIRIESAWSLVPSAETLSQNTVRYDAVPQLTSGIAALNSAVNERLMEPYFRADAAVSVNPLHVWTEIAGFVWAAGCAALLLYALVRLVQTKRRVREAALLGDNVWLCDAVASPFILGVLRPRVYLPSGLDGTAQDYVLAHERAHLARRDHWWKPLGYLLLAVYWFQPLCWFAYRRFCQDLELLGDGPAGQPGSGAGLRRAGRAGAGPRGAEGLFVRAALVRNGGTGGAGLPTGIRRGGCEGACETGAEL